MPSKTFDWCAEEVGLKCRSFVRGKHAHIVIRSPKAEHKPTECDGPVIYQAFYDLAPERCPREFKKYLFRPDQAQEMVNFVMTVKEKFILINCEAGISRSAGAALAFRRYFGGNTEEIFKRAVPNIHVTSLLSEVLRGLGDQGKE